MDRIEEALEREKQKFDSLQAPDEMEWRLRRALDSGKMRRKPLRRLAMVASLIFILFFTYHFETLAYYGKSILGYDVVMSQTLRDLNELGKGQRIGKTHTFSNGVNLTLDGIMVDDSQLLAFYRLEVPQGDVDDMPFLSALEMKGLLGSYPPSSGQGELQRDGKGILWVHSFDPPRFYERHLKFQGYLEVNGRLEEFSINFQLDRHKAMGHHIKQRLNRSIHLKGQKVHFDSILASKTQTVIRGSLASRVDLALEKMTGNQVRPSVDFNLIANGKKLESRSGELSTSLKGIRFKHDFDPLPEDLEDLKIQIIGLTIDKKLNETLSIHEGIELEVEGQRIQILSIQAKEGKTEITFETEESVLLPGVELIADGEVIPLKATHSEEFRKTNRGVLKRRTILFEGTGEVLRLKLNHIHYTQEFNETLEIPL